MYVVCERERVSEWERKWESERERERECVCVYVCVYVNALAALCLFIYTHTRVCTWIHVCMHWLYAESSVCMNGEIYVCNIHQDLTTNDSFCLCALKCIYSCTHVYMDMNMYCAFACTLFYLSHTRAHSRAFYCVYVYIHSCAFTSTYPSVDIP